MSSTNSKVRRIAPATLLRQTKDDITTGAPTARTAGFVPYQVEKMRYVLVLNDDADDGLFKIKDGGKSFMQAPSSLWEIV
jgi:hypothetical protein